MARLEVLDGPDSPDGQSPASHRLAVDGLERLDGWLPAQDAYRDVARLGQHLVGPLDELDEVVQERRLDLVLVNRLGLYSRGCPHLEPRGQEGGRREHARKPSRRHGQNAHCAPARTIQSVWSWGPLSDW